jgi:hypothetical protein
VTLVFIDYQDDDSPSIEVELAVVPRIGEKVGIRPVPGQSAKTFYLDYVVDVRHYMVPVSEIRVLTSSSP